MSQKHTKTEAEILRHEIQAPDAADVADSFQWIKIPHYYGDYIRNLLIAGAILILTTAPFYTNDLPTSLPFIALGTVAIVFVAAMTNPWKKTYMRADMITSGIGFVLFEFWALQAYQNDPIYKTVIRETIALIFLFAFYFSTKTLRNMMFNSIGRPDIPDEFSPTAHKLTRAEEKRLSISQQAHEALHTLNEHEKVDYND